MSKKIVDTIVIGAGISGLACAHHLQTYNEDFLIISKDIGGRILTSKDGTANYGAFFVCSDYDNVLPFVTLQKRIRLSDFCFHENDDVYTLYEPQLLIYLHQFMHIKKLLYQFRKAFRNFRNTSEKKSQKKAIEADPLLHRLYKKDAADFVKENDLERGTDKYLSKALYSTTFSPVHEMNAFSFLQFLIPLITPIFTFKFERSKMTSSFEDKIIIDSAEGICYEHDCYKIKTERDTFFTKNLVLATEISWSSNFAGINKMNKPVSTHMLHVRGTPKKIIARKKYQLYCHPSTVQSIADLRDGTYLFYYKDKQPHLDNFFSNPQVIAHQFWNPAGRINGHTLIESDRGNNMYLIGDYNIAGLEEAYITGMYAANQIIIKK